MEKELRGKIKRPWELNLGFKGYGFPKMKRIGRILNSYSLM